MALLALVAAPAGASGWGSDEDEGTSLERAAVEPAPRAERRAPMVDRPVPSALRVTRPAAGAVTGETAAAPPAPTEEPPPPAAPAPPPVVNLPPPRPDRVAPPAQERPPATAESTAVYPGDFPDPYVVRANGAYWAFSTQVGLTAVPTLRSVDLLTWELVGEALRRTPDWAEWGHHWAPAVLQRGNLWILYYTTRHRATGLQCLSRAVGVLPQGPYADDSAAPLVCQTERGGSIDPSPFVDADGRAWLLWKSEGTLQGEPTRIWVQQLSDDGQQLLGQPTQLLERSLPWEHPIIEGPSMALVDGRHHLFYSGNRWETAGYAVGHAVCDSVTGPCRRTSDVPVLGSRPGEAGPGGQEVLHVAGHGPVLVHHAWEPTAVGYPHGARRLHLTSLRFDGDRVHAGAPWRGQARSDVVADLTGDGQQASSRQAVLVGGGGRHH